MIKKADSGVGLFGFRSWFHIHFPSYWLCDHHHPLLGLLQAPPNLSLLLALPLTVLAQHSHSFVHTATAPTSEDKLNSLLGSTKAALLGFCYFSLHPLLCAYLFSPLHKAVTLAVLQTHQTCCWLRELACACFFPYISSELIPSPPLGFCSNVTLLVTSSLTTLLKIVTLLYLGTPCPPYPAWLFLTLFIV